MSKNGNQKHLTLSQRIEIEKGLTENRSFSDIANVIRKDPSTISKEVRLHSQTKERPDAQYTSNRVSIVKPANLPAFVMSSAAFSAKVAESRT